MLEAAGRVGGRSLGWTAGGAGLSPCPCWLGAFGLSGRRSVGRLCGCTVCSDWFGGWLGSAPLGSGRLFGCSDGGRLGSGRFFGCDGFVDSGRSFGAGWLPGRFAGCGGPDLPAFGRLPSWLPGWPMFGFAGLPGGACLTIGCTEGAFAGRKVCTSCCARGCPGCAARACCCLAKGTGGGGGVALAITCRLATAAGGAGLRLELLALGPSTLSREGATAAVELTGTDAISRTFTATAARATGCALTKARCGTAVTAPATFLFTYVTLVMLVLLTMVVL